MLVGDTVIWRNNSLKTHNVQAETAGYNSGRFAPRSAVNHVFPAAGGFPYVCTIHDGMTGEIGVHPLLLSGPARPVQPGASVALHVRAPAAQPRSRSRPTAGRATSRSRLPGRPEGGGHDGHVEPGTLHANVVVARRDLPRRLGRGLEPRAARGGERRTRARPWRRGPAAGAC